MNKRGQTEVITTILLILIVLAAVIIVWQVINRFVMKGGEAIESKTACIDVKLEIAKADASEKNVTITRMAGGEDDALKNVTILVKGVATAHIRPSDPKLTQLQTKIYELPSSTVISGGDEVEVAGILKDGTVCDPTSSIIAVD